MKTKNTDNTGSKGVSRRNFISAAGGAAVSVFLLRVPRAKGAEDNATHAVTYAFLVDSTKCIGCGNCARACKRENDVPEGKHRTWIERYTVSKSRQVMVESPDGGLDGFGPSRMKDDDVSNAFFVPKLCNHCAKPPCVQVCPIGATFRLDDGVVLVDEKQCMGCGYCVQSCPYAARFINEETHTADKCTWCYHRITRRMPTACVEVCPVGARRIGEIKEDGEILELITGNRVGVLKPELGTEPRVFYMGLTKEVR